MGQAELLQAMWEDWKLRQDWMLQSFGRMTSSLGNLRFFILRLSTEWTRPTHMIKDKLAPFT